MTSLPVRYSSLVPSLLRVRNLLLKRPTSDIRSLAKRKRVLAGLLLGHLRVQNGLHHAASFLFVLVLLDLLGAEHVLAVGDHLIGLLGGQEHEEAAGIVVLDGQHQVVVLVVGIVLRSLQVGVQSLATSYASRAGRAHTLLGGLGTEEEDDVLTVGGDLHTIGTDHDGHGLALGSLGALDGGGDLEEEVGPVLSHASVLHDELGGGTVLLELQLVVGEEVGEGQLHGRHGLGGAAVEERATGDLDGRDGCDASTEVGVLVPEGEAEDATVAEGEHQEVLTRVALHRWHLEGGNVGGELADGVGLAQLHHLTWGVATHGGGRARHTSRWSAWGWRSC